jgi:hypothetical protein
MEDLLLQNVEIDCIHGTGSRPVRPGHGEADDRSPKPEMRFGRAGYQEVARRGGGESGWWA